MQFLTIPSTVIKVSSKTPEEGIQWAKDRVDTEQAKYGADVYLTTNYVNLKTNQMGQILSTKYANLIDQYYPDAGGERVFLIEVATKVYVNQVVDIPLPTPSLTTVQVQNMIDASQPDPANFEFNVTAATELFLELGMRDTEIHDLVNANKVTPETIDYGSLAAALDYDQILQSTNPVTELQNEIQNFLNNNDVINTAIALEVGQATTQAIDVDDIQSQASAAAIGSVDAQQIFNEAVAHIVNYIKSDADDIAGTAALQYAREIYSALDSRVAVIESQ